jgi:hypothetical protein
MLKFTDLDKLQGQLEDAQRAFKALYGQLATVHFDPGKPDSIEAAIRTMESAIDDKVVLIEITRWSPTLSLNSRKSTARPFLLAPRKVELKRRCFFTSSVGSTAHHTASPN